MKNTNSNVKAKIRNLINEGSLVLVIIVLCVFFSIKTPYFLNFKNLMNMLVSVSVIGIAAVGFTCTLIASGADLTTGAMMALSSCLSASLVTNTGLPWYVGVLAALGAGLVVGFLNGLLITKFRIAPIVITLGMMSIVRGIAYIYTGGITIFITDPHLKWFGTGKLFGISIPVVIMLLCYGIFYFISRKTVFGRKIFACGSNATASRLAGIKVDTVVTILFGLSGFLSALAGLVMSGIASAALPSSADSYNMDVMTAVLLGGTALTGGEGNIMKTLLGLLIIGIINNGMALLNVQSYWQMLAKGALLIVAVVYDAIRRRLQAN
ncbi:MAG: ABC transporter permease [Candidatus Faecousia sp.]|nr:ABC transporter permease [Clostridiales bacterium]MDY6179451.1 ABC transporter permease [Candidatus Faecousia sp.]